MKTIITVVERLNIQKENLHVLKMLRFLILSNVYHAKSLNISISKHKHVKNALKMNPLILLLRNVSQFKRER